MKRSEINSLIESAMLFFKQTHFALPRFAFFTPADWQREQARAREIIDVQLGWDITDFGSNDFYRTGLLLFTIRNGSIADPHYPKPYAEKIMLVEAGQVTPRHFHWRKTEDIINRGGGNLVVELFNADGDDTLATTPVMVNSDGIRRQVPAGATVTLRPGDSICLLPRQYHTFHGEPGQGRVLVGEVSMVNDDATDNRFFQPAGRFPVIEENEPPRYLLCSDYNTFLRG
jgi:D-lyxose ketol-isomerase